MHGRTPHAEDDRRPTNTPAKINHPLFKPEPSDRHWSHPPLILTCILTKWSSGNWVKANKHKMHLFDGYIQASLFSSLRFSLFTHLPPFLAIIVPQRWLHNPNSAALCSSPSNKCCLEMRCTPPFIPLTRWNYGFPSVVMRQTVRGHKTVRTAA